MATALCVVQDHESNAGGTWVSLRSGSDGHIWQLLLLGELRARLVDFRVYASFRSVGRISWGDVVCLQSLVAAPGAFFIVSEIHNFDDILLCCAFVDRE